MRPWIKQLIPSMFQRRLLLLGAAAALAIALITAQLIRLTVFAGTDALAKAQSVLVDRRIIPTLRGRIFDSKGRLLAQDKPCFDLAVSYPLLNGQWAYEQARRLARQANQNVWHRLDRTERERRILQYLPQAEAAVEQLWDQLSRLANVDCQELELRRQAIRKRVEEMASQVWSARLADTLTDEAASGEPDLSKLFRPIGEQRAFHSILFDIDDSLRLIVERQIAQAEADPASPDLNLAVWRQVRIEKSWKRDYPLLQWTVQVDRRLFPGPLRSSEPLTVSVDGLGLHILGTLRNLWREDNFIREKPFFRRDNQGREHIDLAGYRLGDRVGYWGIERSCETVLRGRYGLIIEHLDGQTAERIDPIPGSDVVLSLDIALQARIAAILAPQTGLMQRQPWHRHSDQHSASADQPLAGAALVMDIASGHILAAVSVPGFTLQDWQNNPQQVWSDRINRPFVFRPIAQAYEPGSTIKPLILAAAMTEHVLTPSQTITCHGMLNPDRPLQLRCWIFKQYGLSHGELTAPQALAHSCNVFFYTLGQRLGGPTLVTWLQRFGLGRTVGCGLDQEIAGDLPSTPSSISPDQAIQMAIGQGPIRWTLLQAASAYAALARTGRWIQPTFLQAIGSQPCQPAEIDLALDPAAVQTALEGLRQAVNEPYGTAHHLATLNNEPIFTVPGLRIWGKTGTADTGYSWIDENADGQPQPQEVRQRGDHAWFIGLVAPENDPQPRYLVAVIVEYAGSGSLVAGPIANQIFLALKQEGYL